MFFFFFRALDTPVPHQPVLLQQTCLYPHISHQRWLHCCGKTCSRYSTMSSA